MRINKSKFFIIIALLIIYGFILSFFYNYFVFTEFKDFSIKLKQVKSRSFVLPQKDTYLLKVWGLKSAEEVRFIRFNREIARPFYFRERGELRESYFKLPFEIVNKGINTLTIDSQTTYSVRIQNYLGKLESGGIFILFNSAMLSKNHSLCTSKVALKAIFITFLLLSIYIFFPFLIKRYFGFSLNKIYFGYFLSYLPCFLIFFIIYLLSKITPYRIIISAPFFIDLNIILIGVIQVLVVICLLIKEVKVRFEKMKASGFFNKNIQAQMKLPIGIRRMLIFRRWYEKCKLNDKLIILSMVSIIICAFLSILKLEPAAEQVANLAYFALIISVLMKFVKSVRKKNED